MRLSWWKILCVLLLAYTLIAGLLHPVPELPILYESIRSLFYHVPMWFTMMILFVASFIYALKFLKNGRMKDDIRSVQFIVVGQLFGCLGMATGMEWATFTWGQAWSNDPKQLGSALCMLIYFAYFALRGAVPDWEKRAKIAGVFNIFAFALIVPLIWILPGMMDSLHPGSGGNVGFNTYDLDKDLRKVFYPGVLGWALLGFWISNLFIRLRFIEKKQLLDEETQGP